MQAQTGIELKDAQQNVLLGQYHLNDETQFVAARMPRQASRPPAAEDVRWQNKPASTSKSAGQLF